MRLFYQRKKVKVYKISDSKNHSSKIIVIGGGSLQLSLLNKLMNNKVVEFQSKSVESKDLNNNNYRVLERPKYGPYKHSKFKK